MLNEPTLQLRLQAKVYAARGPGRSAGYFGRIFRGTGGTMP